MVVMHVRVVLITLQRRAPVVLLPVGRFLEVDAFTCRHAPCLRFHAECMHAVEGSVLVQTLCRYPVRLPITCCAASTVLLSSL
jgi:hypothetical protein